MFTIEHDNRQLSYQAVRKNNALVHPFVTVTAHDQKTGQELELSSILTTVFGTQVSFVEKRYRMVITGLPDQLITLHLKKDRVVAKTAIDGRAVTINRITVTKERPLPMLGVDVPTELKIKDARGNDHLIPVSIDISKIMALMSSGH